MAGLGLAAPLGRDPSREQLERFSTPVPTSAARAGSAWHGAAGSAALQDRSQGPGARWRGWWRQLLGQSTRAGSTAGPPSQRDCCCCLVTWVRLGPVWLATEGAAAAEAAAAGGGARSACGGPKCAPGLRREQRRRVSLVVAADARALAAAWFSRVGTRSGPDSAALYRDPFCFSLGRQEQGSTGSLTGPTAVPAWAPVRDMQQWRHSGPGQVNRHTRFSTEVAARWCRLCRGLRRIYRDR